MYATENAKKLWSALHAFSEKMIAVRPNINDNFLSRE
jgi:hypothetical protein